MLLLITLYKYNMLNLSILSAVKKVFYSNHNNWYISTRQAV